MPACCEQNKQKWSDDEWKQWREEQNRQKAGSNTDAAKLDHKMQRIKEKDAFVKTQVAKAAAMQQGSAASGSGSAGSSVKFQMPDEWTVTVLDPGERDAAKKSPSFSDLQRLAKPEADVSKSQPLTSSPETYCRPCIIIRPSIMNSPGVRGLRPSKESVLRILGL